MAPKMAIAALLIAAAASARTQPADVTVYVTQDASPPNAVMRKAQTIVTWLYAREGFQIAWDRSPADKVIHIRFTRQTPGSFKPDALAYAMPFADGSDSIVVMYDRVEQWARPSQVPVLLAHVLAHEIAHILQACDYHASDGIMKRRWQGADFDAMTTFQLKFTPEAVALMREGLLRVSATGVSATRVSATPVSATPVSPTRVSATPRRNQLP